MIDTAQRIRVVHVLHYMSAGGLEKGVATLIRESSPDIEHIVVCLLGYQDVDKILPEGTRLISLEKPRGNSWRFMLKVARALRELKPCVVHTRNWPGIDGIVGARLAGIRSIIHGEHGWGMDDPDGSSRKRRLARRFLSRSMRTITCVSRDIERWLKKDVRVRCPVRQIYNGVDLSRFDGADGAAVRAEFGVGPDAPLFGLVGRLDPIKDHPTLFRAFARVRERFPEARLLCVGDGPERDRLPGLAGEGVHLAGNRFDIPAVLAALDVYTLTSKNEGISNTILEAMASGLPVIATRVGGNPELVVEGETGALFEPGDVDALVGLMERYAADPGLRAAHGAAGRARTADVFPISKMVASYEKVWRECAELAKR